MKIITLLLPLALLTGSFAAAQLPSACGGGGGSAIACEQACINCNFNGFSGSTQGFPSGTAVDFCGTVENVQWLGFIAGAPNATFTIMPFNCLNGDGVQVALYSDCQAAPLACDKGKMNGGTTPVNISVPLSPGANYFLLIDGYAGDLCSFTVSVDPPDAVFEPPLGAIQQVNGPTKLCPGAQFEFTVPPVFGAGAYIWTGPPGTLFDSIPTPATIVGQQGHTVMVTMGAQSGNICVQAANSCNQTPPCASAIYVEALPDSERPQIVTDTLQFLNCSDDPLRLEMDVLPVLDYRYTWTVDSVGKIVSGQNALEASVDRIGTYHFQVTDKANGCMSETDVRVGPPDQPLSADIGIQHVRCYGNKDAVITVQAVLGGKSPFQYSLDGAPYNISPSIPYLAHGDHHLSIEGANGCVLDTLLFIEQPALLSLDMGPDSSIQLGQAIPLWQSSWVSEPNRIDQLIVDPPQILPLLCDTCRFSPVSSFIYRVTVRDSNGCSAFDERQIAVTKKRLVYFPNAFRPDGADGFQQFRVFCGADVQEIALLQVLNRWGQTVFQKRNFFPDDPEGGWNGLAEGRQLPPDVFIYQAEILFKDGVKEVFQGDFTLVR